MLPFVDQNSLQSQLAPVPVEEQLYVFNDTYLYTCACADLLANSNAWDLPIAAHRPQLCGKGTADELLAQRLQKKLNHLHGILANVTRFETTGDPRQCVCITVHKRSFRSLRCI